MLVHGIFDLCTGIVLRFLFQGTSPGRSYNNNVSQIGGSLCSAFGTNQ